MNLKKISIFLLFIVFCFSTSFIDAQKSPKKKNVSKSKKSLQKTPPKTISGGVVNGKAISLIQPVYPKAATMVGVYGRVSVQILIDINGNVLTATAISGNPLLHKPSKNAALNSKFVPIKIGNEFVRVTGIINYHFLPEYWNWLEIAYSLQEPSNSYYSDKNIEKYFPSSFDEEIRLLNQSLENSPETKNVVIASIQNKLVNNPKASWLFSLGLNLGKIQNLCCRKDEELQEYAQNIRLLSQIKPENISSDFISKLELLVFYIENPTHNTYDQNGRNNIKETLKNLEETFPIFGR